MGKYIDTKKLITEIGRRMEENRKLAEKANGFDDRAAEDKHILALIERLQEKQSAEWSEEDEEMIARICANLEYIAKEAGCDSKVKEKLEERIKWMKRLKSSRLQPHWKPSEEQMDALEKAWLGCDSKKTSIVLSSLMSDLQKLL